jgi:excisionase family DNA binding protein
MINLQSIEGAARILAISPWTLRLYIRKGKITPVRLGRRVLISELELTRVMATGISGLTGPTDGAITTGDDDATESK